MSILVQVLAMGLGALSLSQAQAAEITGISDQNMVGWDATANAVFNRIDVPQVRFITAWDVALHAGDNPCTGDTACERFFELERSIRKAQEEGKQVLVSFDHQVGCESTACPLPSSAGEYRHAIDVFRHAFPTVTEFTAWNEPNHPVKLKGGNTVQPNPVDSPAAAAHYWNQLNAACQLPSTTGQTCTVAAGDFSDGDQLAGYTTEYQASLSATPSVWAVHAYSAVDSGNYNPLANWMNQQTADKPIWITEVGAYNCHTTDPENAHNDAYQNERATSLTRFLHGGPPARLQRVYYYFLAKDHGGQATCPNFDTALIGGGDFVRPALRTVFPNVEPPEALTGPPSSSRETLQGSVDPKGLPTSYLFEYGTTNAYGTATPEGQIGPGSPGGASGSIGPRQPGTTYHYRLVATNAAGTSFGRDETDTFPQNPQSIDFSGTDGNLGELIFSPELDSPFLSTLLNPVVGRPAQVYLANGDRDVYYRGGDGAIWEFTMRMVHSEIVENLHRIGGAAAGDPSAAVNEANGKKYVWFRGTDGAIWQWWWSQAAGWNLQRLGGSAAGDPSGTINPAAENPKQYVWFRGTDGAIWQLWSPGNGWHLERLGGSAAGDPSGTINPGSLNPKQYVWFRGTDGAIWQLWSPGVGWNLQRLGGSAAGDPSGTINPGPENPKQYVWFRGTDGAIWQLWSLGVGWNLDRLGGSAAGDPSGTIDARGFEFPDQYVAFRGTDGQIWQWLWTPTQPWTLEARGGSAAGDPSMAVPAGTSPVAPE